MKGEGLGEKHSESAADDDTMGTSKLPSLEMVTINTTIHVNNVVLISQNNGDYTPIHIDTVELVS